MAVTIREIMKIEGVQERMRLLAGHGGIERVISFITVMEAPDFYEWVTGEEFVLTSWYAFSRQPELQVAAFTELAKQGIAGIAIKVNRFIAAVPPEILRVADAYQLPVFSTARETKFRDLNQTISAELNNFQTNILLEVEKNYKQLVESALSESGFEPLLRSFGRKQRCSCACLTNECKTMGVYKYLDYGVRQNALGRAIARIKNEKQVDSFACGPGYCIFPCVGKGQSLGYLVLLLDAQLDEKRTILAQQLTTFLTLKLLDRIEIEQKALHDLLEEILQGSENGTAELLRSLQKCGLPVERRFRVLIVADVRGTQASNALLKLRECAVQVKNLLKTVLLIEKYDRMIVLAADATTEQEHRKIAWLRPLTAYAQSHADGIVIAVGPSVECVGQVKDSYEIAERMTEVAALQELWGVMYFRSHMVQTYLLRGRQAPEGGYIVRLITGRLRDYDARYGTDLFATMRRIVFVSSLKDMAALLHLHVNTVRYRLKKIREITGFDFFSTSDRYVLMTAVLLDSFQEKERA